MEDIIEHDKNEDTTEMDEDKKALTTESKSIWNQGDLRKNSYQYGTGLLKIISFWQSSLFKFCNFQSLYYCFA